MLGRKERGLKEQKNEKGEEMKMTHLKKALCLLLSTMLVLGSMSAVHAEETESTGIGSADVNLALGKSGAASTTQDSNTPFSKALDADQASRWASQAGKDSSDIDQTWAYVDLGTSQKVSKVILKWESRPNKFKIQVSDNLEQWQDVTDVIDNGFYQDSSAAAPDKVYTNTIEFEETVRARYVKMQGVQRRRQTDTDNNTGFSLYEFEIYGPGWVDEDYVREYLETLKVNSRVYRNFTLPVSDETYGVTVEWTSDNPAIVIDAQGNAVVTREEQDVEVTLTAKVKRGGESASREFIVTVASGQAREYEFSPIPQNVTYGSDTIAVTDTVNLVFGNGVSDIVKGNYQDVLSENGIAYEVSGDVQPDQTNILVGIKGQDGIVSDYFSGTAYDPSISTDKQEGYVLNVSSEKNTIAVMGADEAGTKYGTYTLADMLEQGEGILQDILIEDAPDIQFRGFIEGFYGSWSHENRKSLIEFGGRYKMNTYIYGPKNDQYHYGQWKEMYPEDKLAELKELVDLGKETGVEFVWAAHPGGHTDLSDADIEAMEAKFDQLYDIGVRQFAIFFDDSSTNNTRLVEYMNKLQTEYVEAKGDVKPLIFCPQYYNKKNGNESYLRNLRNFDKDIQIMWTGDFVVSEINQSVIDYIVNLIERPVFIWWNWPVNDLGRSHLMHLGPSDALEIDIQNMSGMTSNPMNQAQASKVALYSIADYTWNTGTYDSYSSWMRAITHIITDNEEASRAFQIFAQNCAAAPMSFPETDESVYLQDDIAAFQSKFLNGEDYSAQAEQLKAEFKKIRDAITTLRGYTGTNNISGEIEPWMKVVDKIAEAGYYTLDHAHEFDNLNKEDDASLETAMDIINEGRSLLYASNGGKQAAQKVLYPFVEELLNQLEAKYYEAVGLAYPMTGYGSAGADYTKALDGQMSTWAEIGQYTTDNYFGVKLGNVTAVKTIDITMDADDGGWYKKGVLEYSNDNEIWTEIGEYDTPVIHADLEGVNARFIRYRATEMWENEVTGENTSNVSLYEFSINKGADYHLYTDQDALNETAVMDKKDNLLAVSFGADDVLESGNYMGVRFDVLKNVQKISISMPEGAIKLEVSADGEKWTEQKPDVLKNFEAKYIRVKNESSEALSLGECGFSVQLAGKADLTAKVSDSIISQSDIYSGNAANLVDGNESTTLWLKRGNSDHERYIQLELTDVIPLYELEAVYAKDWANGGRVELSSDGQTWETAAEFSSASALQKLDLQGIPAKYVRYYINTGEWCNLAEIYINRSLDEDVLTVSGDGTDLRYLTDGNAFTYPSLTEAGGSVIYSFLNESNVKTVYLLKNKDTAVTLEVMTESGWQNAGTLDKIYNVADISAYGDASQIRLSWDGSSEIVLYELWAEESEAEEKPVSKKNLEYFLDQAKQYQAAGEVDDCVESVKALFKKAIEEGESVMADESATREEVLNAAAKLMKAIQALGMKAGDKTDLEMALELTEMIDLDKYVEDGQADYLKAKENAENVMADGDAFQEDVDAAWNALTEALSSLRLKADKTVLKELLTEAEGMDLTKYTEESVQIFHAALAKAQIVMADVSLSVNEQTAVNEAAEALRTARDGLVKKTESDADDSAGEEIPGGSETPDDSETPGSSGGSDGNGTSGGSGTIDDGTAGQGENAGNNTAINTTAAGQSGTNARKAAKTGDDSTVLPVWLMVMAAAGITGCIAIKKRGNKKLL